MLAAERNLRTVAFPAISTGAYGFPLERATEIAVHEAQQFFQKAKSVEKIIFVCFGRAATEVYEKALKQS
jgi:O-acetyl-ADP-ribose deacetylase (regulator of RNase III)